MLFKNKKAVVVILVLLVLLDIACTITTGSNDGQTCAPEANAETAVEPAPAAGTNEVAAFDLKPHGCDFTCVARSYLGMD